MMTLLTIVRGHHIYLTLCCSKALNYPKGWTLMRVCVMINLCIVTLK